jgi:4-hydroxy-tetrahydrodipicolinate synthase
VVRLCEAAKTGNAIARTKAQELEQALGVLSSFDEGVDLVLYYKYLMCLEGHDEYAVQMCADDTLTPSQKGYAEKQLHLFKSWYSEWSVKD